MRLYCLSLSIRPQFRASQMDDLAFTDLCGQLQLDGVDLNVDSRRTQEKDGDPIRERTLPEPMPRGMIHHGLGISLRR